MGYPIEKTCKDVIKKFWQRDQGFMIKYEKGVIMADKQEKVLKEFSRARLNEEAVSIEKVH